MREYPYNQLQPTVKNQNIYWFYDVEHGVTRMEPVEPAGSHWFPKKPRFPRDPVKPTIGFKRDTFELVQNVFTICIIFLLYLIIWQDHKLLRLRTMLQVWRTDGSKEKGSEGAR